MKSLSRSTSVLPRYTSSEFAALAQTNQPNICMELPAYPWRESCPSSPRTPLSLVRKLGRLTYLPSCSRDWRSYGKRQCGRLVTGSSRVMNVNIRSRPPSNNKRGSTACRRNHEGQRRCSDDFDPCRSFCDGKQRWTVE